MTAVGIAADLDQGDAVELLACQTDVLELISTGASLTVLLDCITRGLELLMPGSRCSILLLHAGRLRHGSAPSLPAHYLDAIDGLAPGPNVGSCGSAAHLGRAVIATDIRTDERWAAFRASASAVGVRACWSTPICARGSEVLGTFAVYHDDVHRPTRREQHVVDRFTHLACVAIEHATLFGALTESEERFRRAFEDNAVAMALLDTAGRLTRVNDALVRLAGVERDDLVGHLLADSVAASERDALSAGMADVRTGRRRSLLLESRIARPTRPDALVSLTMSLVRGAQGEPVQLSVNLLDVTEKRAAARERLARREADLARCAAEAASRAKSELLSAVSHEMRTPLQAITGFAELLATLPLDAERRSQALGHITNGATHLLELVDDTLDLARIEAGALRLSLAPVPLVGAIDDVVDFLAPVARDHGVTLSAAPVGAELNGHADRRRLRQVLINLVSNAVRYAGPGASVTVEAGADGDEVSVRVRDDGPGIDPSIRARLFEPFVRTTDGDGTRPGSDGIGLGLMLAHGLTIAMGGRLELASPPGGGTLATVRLRAPNDPGASTPKD